MRIFLVYHYFAHYRLAIINELAKRNVTFCSGNKTDINIRIVPETWFSANGISFKLMTNIWIGKKILIQPGLVKIIFFKNSSYILLGNPYFITNWIFMIVCKLFNKRVYLWTHGFYGKEGPVVKYLKITYFSLASHLFFYGEHAKILAIKYGLDKDSISVIYNSLDYAKQKRVRELVTNLARPIEEDYFVFIGRLTTQKRLDILIKAVAGMDNRKSIVIIGDGLMKSELKLLARSLNVKCYFLGEVYDENIIGLYLYHSLACASPGEVGLTAMHSLSYGTPVITHNCKEMQMPEFECISENLTGDFYEYKSVQDLTLKLIKWANIKGREQIRLNCIKVIEEKYNPETQCDLIFNNLH